MTNIKINVFLESAIFYNDYLNAAPCTNILQVETLAMEIIPALLSGQNTKAKNANLDYLGEIQKRTQYDWLQQRKPLNN